MTRKLKDATAKDRLKEIATPTDEMELKNFNTRLPEELIYQLKVYCIRQRVPIQQFVKDALTAQMEQNPPPPL